MAICLAGNALLPAGAATFGRQESALLADPSLSISSEFQSQALSQPLANWARWGLNLTNHAAVRLWQAIRPKRMLVKNPGAFIAIGTLAAMAAWSRFAPGTHWWSWKEIAAAIAVTWLIEAIAHEILGYKALTGVPKNKRLAALWRVVILQVQPNALKKPYEFEDIPEMMMAYSMFLLPLMFVELGFRNTLIGVFLLATMSIFVAIFVDMLGWLPGTSIWLSHQMKELSEESRTPAEPKAPPATQAPASIAPAPQTVAETPAVISEPDHSTAPDTETTENVPWLYTMEGIMSIGRMGARRRALPLHPFVEEATSRSVAPLPPEKNPRELHRPIEQLTNEEQFWGRGFTRGQLEGFLRMALRERSGVLLSICPYPSAETRNDPPLEITVRFSFDIPEVVDRVEAYGRAQMEKSHELGQPYYVFAEAMTEQSPLPVKLTVEPYDQTTLERHFRRRPPQPSVEQIGPYEMGSDLEVKYTVQMAKETFEWTDEEASLAERYYRGELSLAQLRDGLQQVAHPRPLARVFNALNQVWCAGSVEELEREGKIAFQMLRGSLTKQQAEARLDKKLDVQLAEAQMIAAGVGVRYDIGPVGWFGIAAELAMMSTVNPPDEFILGTEAGFSDTDVRKIMAEARDYQAGRLPKPEPPLPGTQVKVLLPYEVAKDFNLAEELTIDTGRIPNADELLDEVYRRYPLLRRFVLVVDVNGRQQEWGKPVSRSKPAQLRYVGTPDAWQEVLRNQAAPKSHRYPWGLFLPGPIETPEDLLSGPFESPLTNQLRRSP